MHQQKRKRVYSLFQVCLSSSLPSRRLCCSESLERRVLVPQPVYLRFRVTVRAYGTPPPPTFVRRSSSPSPTPMEPSHRFRLLPPAKLVPPPPTAPSPKSTVWSMYPPLCHGSTSPREVASLLYC